MRRAFLIGFALLASLLVATQPAAAVHGPIVVSSHTTDTDFNAGTLTNMTVTGSGESANIELSQVTGGGEVFDSFEDGDLAEWDESVDSSFDVVKTRPYHGRWSMNISGSGDTATWNFTNSSYTNTSFAYRPSSFSSRSPWFTWTAPDGSSAIRFGVDFGGTLETRTAGGGWDDTGIDLSADEYNLIIVENIDYNAGTFDVRVENASGLVGTATGHEFENAASQLGQFQAGGGNGGATGNLDDVNPGAETINEAGAPGFYISQNHTVENSEQGFVNITENTNATVTVTWESSDGGPWHTLNQTTGITTTGNKTFTWTEEPNSTVRVNVTVENATGNGVPAFTMAAEGVLFVANDTHVDNGSASPSGELTSASPTVSIDVNDADFPLAQGDSVEVKFFVDGSSVGTDTLTSNGTASLSHTFSGGDHDWHAVANDSYGHSVASQTFSVSAPGNITIRNVTEPHDIVKTASVEVVVAGSNETVDRATVTDGNYSLQGLPLDETYVVIVDAPGYHIRSIVVKDVFDQSSVFVLNESLTSVQNAFLVNDLTGNYPEPTLSIVKIINRSLYDSSAANEYQWTVIGGDRLGADTKMVIDLEKDSRYRLVIENDEGEVRVLGEYTARLNETVSLTVGEIVWQSPSGDDYRIDTYQEELDSGGERIVVQYQDNSTNTSQFCVTIHERDNTSNVLYSQSCHSDLGTVKITQPVSGADLNTSWVVNWTATQDGASLGSTIPVTGADELDIPIEARWLGPIILIGLIALLSAAPKDAARTGAVVVVAMAFGLTWWGWVSIPGPALGIAGAIALLGKAADFNRSY